MMTALLAAPHIWHHTIWLLRFRPKRKFELVVTRGRGFQVRQGAKHLAGGSHFRQLKVLDYLGTEVWCRRRRIMQLKMTTNPYDQSGTSALLRYQLELGGNHLTDLCDLINPSSSCSCVFNDNWVYLLLYGFVLQKYWFVIRNSRFGIGFGFVGFGFGFF